LEKSLFESDGDRIASKAFLFPSKPIRVETNLDRVAREDLLLPKTSSVFPTKQVLFPPAKALVASNEDESRRRRGSPERTLKGVAWTRARSR
jgi:hypothetical protein